MSRYRAWPLVLSVLLCLAACLGSKSPLKASLIGHKHHLVSLSPDKSKRPYVTDLQYRDSVSVHLTDMEPNGRYELVYFPTPECQASLTLRLGRDCDTDRAGVSVTADRFRIVTDSQGHIERVSGTRAMCTDDTLTLEVDSSMCLLITFHYI
ncbi:hypothetical protein KIPB_000450 [Kipferlia bialata]|uniref:Lipoprotein n=1 Tax=Kipferlia bialata TaxID=797122 RepID=A0A9K3GEP2_9EUKA|nr:hypothetical protein KIPB_000450 [Kipferlia bialata]|eukprot:g450.t1